MADKYENAPLTEAAFYILLSVTKPLHGYGIIQNVKERTNGRLVLAAGTLYGAIANLQAKEWIKAINEDSASRKKEYIITPAGMTALENELARLKELVENGEDILRGL